MLCVGNLEFLRFRNECLSTLLIVFHVYFQQVPMLFCPLCIMLSFTNQHCNLQVCVHVLQIALQHLSTKIHIQLLILNLSLEF
jgi:hypothetical protein